MDATTYIKRILQSYPEIKRKPPEQRTRNERRRVDAVDGVISLVERMEDGEKIKTMIRRVYFDKTHTLYGAAVLVPVSERTAQRWNKQVIQMMVKILDLP